MKKHFVKYIPVEGEINPDDWMMDSFGNIFKCKSKEGNKILGTAYLTYVEGEPKKLKLFLCSRDIQVGDITYVNIYEDFLGKTDNKTIKIENSPSHLPDGLMCYSEDGYYEYLKDCIKVIGEISPDAVWVTEGMEFDEDEIQLWATCDLISPSHPVMIQPHSWNKPREEWQEGRNEGDSPQRVWHDEHWRIQCPTCKQFH